MKVNIYIVHQITLNSCVDLFFYFFSFLYCLDDR